MFFFRILIFSTIIITSFAAIANDYELEDDGVNNADPDLVNLSGIGYLIPIIYLSTFYHNSLPTTTQFIKDKKVNLPIIVNFTMVTIFVLFSTLGLVTNFAIEDVEKMITLNWRNYSAGDDPDNRAWWCYLIAYIVVLLPALEIASIFPIIATNLCDNVMSYQYGHQDLHKLEYVRGYLEHFYEVSTEYLCPPIDYWSVCL